MELIGDHVRLRPWRIEDAEVLVRHANNRKVWRNLTDAFPHPYTLEAAHEWLGKRTEEAGPPTVLAVEVAGEAVGGAGVKPLQDVYARTLEIGYWLSESYWGRGLGTEAAGLLVRYAFANFEVERLEAGVFGWNPASARVLEKNGFRLEGRLRHGIFKDGEFTDRLLYGLLRSDVQTPDGQV